jgi:hypothetical protein
MCVILVATDKRPSPELIAKAYDYNPEGAGAAWRKDGEVYWEKGCTLERMQEIAATVDLPFIEHFRISSVGKDNILPELTHPFLIEENAPLSLQGHTKSAVLFHNGHWSQWKSFLLDSVRMLGWKLPKGKWSDTRAMAWYAAHVGTSILDFLDQKTVAFSPDDCEVFGTGWTMVEGILASNNSFEFGMKNKGGVSYYDTAPASMGGKNQTWTRVEGPTTAATPPSMSLVQRAAAIAEANKTGGSVQVHRTNPPQETIDLRNKDVSVAKNGEITVRTPGASSNVLPFVKGVPRGVPLAELRRMHANGALSKNKLKKAEKAFYKAQQQLIAKVVKSKA